MARVVLLAMAVAGLSWLGHSGPLGGTEGDRYRVAGGELHFVAAHRDGDVVALYQVVGHLLVGDLDVDETFSDSEREGEAGPIGR